MATLFFPTMSLLRRIRHRASRRQLGRESFFFYAVTFVFIFLDLHYFGIKHYYPSFHRELLPVNAAALKAVLWAFVGPALWVLQEFVLQRSEVWSSFSRLDSQLQNLVLAGVGIVILATVVAWQWMLPLWGIAAAVALYLRFSRPKDSL